MGTSKGYISPTRIQWSNSKRAVGEMIKHTSSQSIAKSASRFSTAMKSDMSAGGTITFTSAAAGVLGFIKSATSNGIDSALKEINREDLIGKNSDEIWDELLYTYTQDGKTDEDSLAIDALSISTKNLNIDLEHLNEVKQDVLLKEMLANYICLKFEFHYEEKIGKDKSPSEKNDILRSMKGYIRSNVYENLSLKEISSIDFYELNGSQYVEDALRDAFSTLEEMYVEE